jgi:hypothetical protein
MSIRKRLRSLETSTIRTDRELLEVLGMKDALAAMYLGKSRQALNNKLGSKRSGDAPRDYLKVPEILVLAIAAKRNGHPFDESAVRSYVEETRDPAKEEKDGPYSLLMQILGNSTPLALDRATAVVLILPDFEKLRAEHTEAASCLRDIAAQMRESETDPWIVILSSSELRAKTAAKWLHLDGDRVYTLCHTYVDHYVPLLLAYDEGEDDPRPFMLTNQGTLVAAPQYRAPTMSMCVADMLKDMLPVEAFREIFPSGAPAEEERKTAKQRR